MAAMLYLCRSRSRYGLRGNVGRCSGRVVGHSETGPKWVLGEISPVMSRHIMLAGSGLRQRLQKHRAAICICISRRTSTARGHASRLLWLHPSTQASIAAGASWRSTAGAWGASEAGADVVWRPPGPVRALGRALEPGRGSW